MFTEYERERNQRLRNANRRGVKASGVTEVKATPEEVAEWYVTLERKGRTKYHPPYRVACDACGKRFWLSGVGLGSHRRACRGSAQ